MSDFLHLPLLARETVFKDSDDKEIISALIDEYVNPLLRRGHYLQSELPPNAMRSYHVDYYMAQVANGGHRQFMHNSDLPPSMLKDIGEGLAAIGIEGYLKIFDEFRAFVESDPQRAERLKEFIPSWSDPTLDDFDNRFFAFGSCYKTLMPANGRWLKNLPELKILTDVEFEVTLENLIVANPGGRARKLAMLRPVLAKKLQSTIEVAARLLGEKARIDSMALGYSDPAGKTPEGRNEVVWTLRCGGDYYRMFVLDQVAYLYFRPWRSMPSLAPAPPIADLRIGEPPWKERAQVPIALVEEARSAAENGRVLAAAEMICMKYGDELHDVYAGGKNTDGYWYFRVKGENGLYALYVLPNGVGVRGWNLSVGEIEPMVIELDRVRDHMAAWEGGDK